jgi:hypothetical protein
LLHLWNTVTHPTKVVIEELEVDKLADAANVETKRAW